MVAPEILELWIRGWAAARGLGPPTPAFGGHFVHVGAPDQEARVVFPDAESGLGEASVAFTGPHVLLKACAPPEPVAARLGPGWEIRSATAFMALDDLPTGDPAPAHPCTPVITKTPAGVQVEARLADGQLCARGEVVVFGEAAVFDRIETSALHRRQGLGRHIMAVLSQAASLSGARFGLLVATAEGRTLYEALGWRVMSPYTTAARGRDTKRGPPEDGVS